VRGGAEHLPFPGESFDAVRAVLTLHHWSDLEAGVAEMQRVAPRQVVFFFEPQVSDAFWLVAEYLPYVPSLESERRAPGEARLRELLDVGSVAPVPVPADCVDGFGASYWNRPERYLDPDVQAGVSCCSQVDAARRAAFTEQLRADLDSGAWDERHGHLRALDELDAGYRLLVAGR
jgi:SAM-dependent methyltransferase